jgi:microsomal dipeptidase-like Zn-dependent dipeptidase
MSKFAAALVSAVMLASGIGGAEAAPEWAGEAKALTQKRRAIPEDRYAMAGGCYALSTSTGYVVRQDDGYSATGAEGEPFHFQATDLGEYLLFDAAEGFLAASEGVLGEVALGATRSHPGAMAGGVLLEQTDRAAESLARSQANEASGRGAEVVSASAPSELADWEVGQAGSGSFRLILPATGQALVVGDNGGLDLVRGDQAGVFNLELTDGCASFPEVEINVDGPVVGGKTSFQEVRGYLDAHLHMMAFEFLGGRARCGRPWHRYGVAYALVDCPDHEPGGHGAILEQFLSKEEGKPHHTDGWPTFEGWPRHNSLTHEQVYYKWLERAWRGGQRMFVNLLVDNNQLCKIYPFKRNSCNEMDGVRLQAERIRELERYIDAQSGGPGEGWLRIVTDPFEARRVMNDGKLAVVLGIEVSVPFDCGILVDVARCDVEQIDARLDEVYALGVRQMELVNKFDNALSGVAGDAGALGMVVNQGNKLETGHYWRMETCTEEDGHAHDKHQMNFHDESGAPDEFSGRDSLVGGILTLAGKSGAAPIYPEGPHCNSQDLSPLGEHMIRGMAERGMIFDPDHMSARARTQALDLIEELGHSGVVSSHGWADETIYPRIYKAGGVVTPYAGGSEGFVGHWREHKQWADDRYYFGFGYGADTNGFGSQGGPRGTDIPNPVEYPFQGFGGVTIHQQQSGTRTYDVNRDGVAHYGLYPDWIEDLRRQAGDDIVADLARGPEAYLQMWERAVGVAPDSCRPDVADLSQEQIGSLAKGMTPQQVIYLLGQPASRTHQAFTYCVADSRLATVRFNPGDGKRSGTLVSVSVTPRR